MYIVCSIAASMLKYMNIVRELCRGSFNIRHVYVLWRMHSARDKLVTAAAAAAAHMARRTAAVER